MVCDTRGVPLHFILSGGQASDISHAQPWLDGVRISTERRRPRKRCRKLIADKGYDAEFLRQYCDRYRMQPVIPYRLMKRKPNRGCRACSTKPNTGSATLSSDCFRLAEGASSLGDPLLQARKKLCRDGQVGLRAAVSTTLLFV